MKNQSSYFQKAALEVDVDVAVAADDADVGGVRADERH